MARQRPGEDPIEARLVAAAQRVLRRDGLAAVTVRKVAAEAELSVGVLYNHFSDADHLVASALIRQMSQVGGDVPAGREADIALFAQTLLDQIRETMPIATGLLSRPSLQARLRAHTGGFEQPRLGVELTEALRAEQTAGRINAGIDVADVVLSVTTLIHGVGMIELLSGEQTSPDWLARMLVPYEQALRRQTRPL